MANDWIIVNAIYIRLLKIVMVHFTAVLVSVVIGSMVILSALGYTLLFGILLSNRPLGLCIYVQDKASVQTLVTISRGK